MDHGKRETREVRYLRDYRLKVVLDGYMAILTLRARSVNNARDIAKSLSHPQARIKLL